MSSTLFSMGYQYQLYLEKVGLKEEHMHPVQRIETKRAFMGACGQLLLLLRDDVSKLDDEIASFVTAGMIEEVVKFWLQTQGELG